MFDLDTILENLMIAHLENPDNWIDNRNKAKEQIRAHFITKSKVRKALGEDAPVNFDAFDNPLTSADEVNFWQNQLRAELRSELEI